MTQLGLPYAKGSATSRAAAVSVRFRAPSMRAEILDWIVKAGARGMTGDNLEEVTGYPHQTVGPRLLELRKMGLVVDSGATRPTRSGRQAVVWRAK